MTQQARRACRLPVPSGKRGFRPQTAAAICGAIIPRKQKESSPPSLNALLFTDRVKMSIEGRAPPGKRLFLLPPPSTPSFFPRRFMSRLSVRAEKRKEPEQGNATEETRRREVDTRGKSADAREGASAPHPRSEATSSSAPGRRRGMCRASRPLCERRKHTQEDVPFTTFRGNEQDIRTRGRPFVRTRKSACPGARRATFSPAARKARAGTTPR